MGKSWGILVSCSMLAVIACSGGAKDNTAQQDSTPSTPQQTTAAPQDSVTKLSATLTGAAEAPNPGETNGKGTASLTLDQAKHQICYTIQVSGLQGGATGAHIHQGKVGESGSVAVPLQAPKNGSVDACTQVDSAVIAKMAQNPGDYYVNVHDAKFPKGAIRGQLERVM